jgi:DNA-binding beta-propeller fold protein YncE
MPGKGRIMRKETICVFAILGAALWTPPADAQLAVSANDAHSVNVNGVNTTPKDAPPDSLSLIDLSQRPPKVIATLDVPTSVAGPPMAVALSRDESFAIVSSANKADPQNPGKAAPSDEVSVVDLKASPPAIIQRTKAGLGATGIAISPDEKLVLIANRRAGTLSVFTLADKVLTPSQTLDFGKGSGPCGVVFTKDGKFALVTRDDNMVSVLDIDGDKVSVEQRPVTTGYHPYTIDINVDGTLAAVANMGRSNGDVDTVALIDLTQQPFHVVEQAAVASAPEGLKFSPDGKFLAIASQENSNKAPKAAFYHAQGVLRIFAVDGQSLHPLADAPVGGWSQGIAFSSDGATILVQNMIDRNISVFHFADGKLTAEAPIPVNGGAAAIATARR